MAINTNLNDYLDPDYDLDHIKVVDLKDIFRKNDIHFDKKERKAELLQKLKDVLDNMRSELGVSATPRPEKALPQWEKEFEHPTIETTKRARKFTAKYLTAEEHEQFDSDDDDDVQRENETKTSARKSPTKKRSIKVVEDAKVVKPKRISAKNIRKSTKLDHNYEPENELKAKIESSPTKRRPGRPRKVTPKLNNNDEPESELLSKIESSPTKKRPGRPRKVTPKSESTKFEPSIKKSPTKTYKISEDSFINMFGPTSPAPTNHDSPGRKKLKAMLQSTVPAKRTVSDVSNEDGDDTSVYKDYSRVLKKPVNHKNQFSSSPNVSKSSINRVNFSKTNIFQRGTQITFAESEEGEEENETSVDNTATQIDNKTFLSELDTDKSTNSVIISHPKQSIPQSSPLVSYHEESPLDINTYPVSAPTLLSSTPSKIHAKSPKASSKGKNNIKQSYRYTPKLNSLGSTLKGPTVPIKFEESDDEGESQMHTANDTFEAIIKKKPVQRTTPTKQVTPKKYSLLDGPDDTMLIRTPEMPSEDEEELKKLQQEFEIETHKVEKESQEALKMVERSKHSVATTKILYQILFAMIGFILIFESIALYRSQMILVGFCGHEVTKPIFNFDRDAYPRLGEIATNIEHYLTPCCVPCPEHGECHELSKLECDHDFLLYVPWYKGFGFIPSFNECILDKQKLKKVQQIVKSVLDVLAQRNADCNCGEGTDDEVAMDVNDLQNYVVDYLHLNREKITGEFDYLWNKSQSILKSKSELTFIGGDYIDLDHNSGKIELDTANYDLIRSHSLSRLTVKCKLKVLFKDIFFRYKWQILGFSLILLVLGYIYYKLKMMFRKLKIIKEVKNKVLSKLQEQSKEHKVNKVATPYLGKIHLRDFFLKDFSLTMAQKNAIWNEISKHVESDANVSSKTEEFHGEILKLWEWVSDI